MDFALSANQESIRDAVGTEVFQLIVAAKAETEATRRALIWSAGPGGGVGAGAGGAPISAS